MRTLSGSFTIIEPIEFEFTTWIRNNYFVTCFGQQFIPLTQRKLRIFTRRRTSSTLTSLWWWFCLFLVGASRFQIFNFLQSHTSTEVYYQLDVMVAFLSRRFRSTNAPRICRPMLPGFADYLGIDEPENSQLLFFKNFLRIDESSTGHYPQADGTAARSVGLIKVLSARCFWHWVSEVSIGVMLCDMRRNPWFAHWDMAISSIQPNGLQQEDWCFGITCQIIHFCLHISELRLSTRRTFQFWFLLTHFLLLNLVMPHLMTTLRENCWWTSRKGYWQFSAKNDAPERVVRRFDRPLKVDTNEPIEVDHVELNAFEVSVRAFSRFSTFFWRIVEMLTWFDADLPMDTAEGPRTQATTHINVTSEEVAKSTGEHCRKWVEARKTEISTMTTKKLEDHEVGTLELIDPPKQDRLKSRATIEGYQYIKLHTKVVGTIKPTNSNAGSLHAASDSGFFRQTFGHRPWYRNVSMLSWAASSSDNSVASLGITAAFLNAEFPPGRVVVLRPPSILYRLNLIPWAFCWRVHRVIHGLREAPSLWQDERTSEVTKVWIRVQGEEARVIVSQVPQALCTIVKKRDLVQEEVVSKFGIHKRVGPQSSFVMIKIYLDDTPQWARARRWNILLTMIQLRKRCSDDISEMSTCRP